MTKLYPSAAQSGGLPDLWRVGERKAHKLLAVSEVWWLENFGSGGIIVADRFENSNFVSAELWAAFCFSSSAKEERSSVKALFSSSMNSLHCMIPKSYSLSNFRRVANLAYISLSVAVKPKFSRTQVNALGPKFIPLDEVEICMGITTPGSG